MVYVRLLTKKEGRDWARRQGFGPYASGSREVEGAKTQAALASMAWQRIEPETEFKIEVSDQPWR